MSNRSQSISRRQFIRTTSAAAIASTALSYTAIAGANEKVLIGVMGASRNDKGGNGRGSELAVGFAGQKNAEVAFICDVDERHLGKAVEAVAAKQSRRPQGVSDFRQMMDDASVDAIVIATPDHWHAPATIYACAANKHVYCEKPACHNPAEGEMMLNAARKYNRKVQLGTQRRSWPGIIEAMQRIKAGDIGRVLLSQSYYFNNRPTIGRGRVATVPTYLNYNFWQGPAPERGYRDICDLLHGSLSDPQRRFAYALDIKEIIVSGDFAAVRLIWTLTAVTRNPPASARTQEYGIDLFRRQADGSWKIIRYLAYEAP